MQAGIDAICAGIPGGITHEASKQVILDSPYAEHIFLSPVGHGVGLEVHELPKMGLNKGEILKPRMVASVEPGICIPGYGGVRIEDTVLVTENGCENLVSYPWDTRIEVGA